MPRVPSVSPATGKPTPDHYIHTTSSNFVDVHGRTLLLRGVNLSGSSKCPTVSQSHVLDGFWEGAEGGGKPFTARPLNVEDGSADVHLTRLKGWGFNTLRYVVTWEALEHQGPGLYDFDFMDYTVRVLRKCKEYGFKVFIDPHQDVWSRFSGGSGAPYWTLLACGINPRNITATHSAILHGEYPLPHQPEPATLPAMLWSTNYGRLASQTLFTLFFAGRDFAPKCVIDGVNIQDYLEHHFFTAFGHLADRIRDAGDLLDSCVIGWDSINEPFEGFCGNPDIENVDTTHNATLKKGTHPTILQSLHLGMGQKQTVENWKFTVFGPQRDGEVTIDPKGRRLWLDPTAEEDGVNVRWGWKRGPEWTLGTCVWALHGVWDIESGKFLNPRYFASSPASPSEPVVFVTHYWKAHWKKFTQRIRASHPEAILFIQPPVFVQPPSLEENELCGRACYSGHYYDGLTLVSRHWNWFNADALGLLRGKYRYMFQAIKIGERDIRKSLQEQLGILKQDAELIGPYPTLIGEIGTPFDMDGKRSYGYTDDGKYAGDYSSQQSALDASLNAADGPNCINWTVWTYCPDHSHEWGDGWNMEDLSIWSGDDVRQKLRYGATSPLSSAATLISQVVVGGSTGVDPAAVARSPSTSTLSLVILDKRQQRGAKPREGAVAAVAALSAWDNPLDFLTDGGRAVPAFSRPYPVATVGEPVDMMFDIGKALFKLTVRVTPDDRPIRRDDDDEEEEEEEEEGEEEEEALVVATSFGDEPSSSKAENLATEIFLPLVHYASRSLVVRSQRRKANVEGEYEGQPVEEMEMGMEMEMTEGETEEEEEEGGVAGGASTGSLGSSVPTLGKTPASSVGVEVEVSGGRWEVEGQVLKWWYDVPLEGSVEYMISITRSNGPILAMDVPPESCWDKLCQAVGC